MVAVPGLDRVKKERTPEALIHQNTQPSKTKLYIYIYPLDKEN